MPRNGSTYDLLDRQGLLWTPDAGTETGALPAVWHATDRHRVSTSGAEITNVHNHGTYGSSLDLTANQSDGLDLTQDYCPWQYGLHMPAANSGMYSTATDFLPTPGNSGAFSLFCLAWLDSGPANGGGKLWSLQWCALHALGTNPLTMGLANGADNAALNTESTVESDRFACIGITYDNKAETRYIDGERTAFAANSGFNATNTEQLSIGNRIGGGNAAGYNNLSMYEYLLYDYALSDQDAHRVAGYLAWHWRHLDGEVTLAAESPYCNSPPSLEY